MNSVSKFELHFDKEDLTFKDGEYVTGFLELVLNEDLKYKSMIFEMKGYSSIFWDGQNGLSSADPSSSDVYKEHYSEKCIMLDKVGNFLDKDPILQAGEHMIPFEVRIPKEVPSSFEGQYGRVRYECRGVIERPSSGFKSNKVTMARKDLVVLATLDLNNIPEASFKIEICKYKELGICCTEGSLTIDWVVVKSGFVPTEEILINGSIQNDSKHAVSNSTVSLIMIVEYKLKKRRLIDRVKIASLERGGINSDDVTVWNDRLLIPSCPPSSLGRSKVVDVSYELEFKVTLENSLTSPITYTKTVYIGTVMLADPQQQQQTTTRQTATFVAYPQAAIIVPCYAPVQSAGVVLTPPPRTAPGFHGNHNAGFDSFSRGDDEDVPMETRPPPYAPGHNGEDFDVCFEGERVEDEVESRDRDFVADFTKTLCIRGNKSGVRECDARPENQVSDGDDDDHGHGHDDDDGHGHDDDVDDTCNGNRDEDNMAMVSGEFNLESLEANEAVSCEEPAGIHSSDRCSDESADQSQGLIQPPETSVLSTPVVSVASDDDNLLMRSND